MAGTTLARRSGNELLSSRLATQNVEVLNEAGAITIVVTCPFCRVVLSDALTSQQAAGSAPESVEVVDVA